MLIRLLCLQIILITSLISSETVSGTSNSFSFPGGIGISNKDVSFTLYKRLTGRMRNGNIYFTWSMKTDVKIGNISIYSLSGKLIKTVKIVPGQGFVKWEAKKSGISNGIYFANMKVGAFKQVIRFSIL